MFEDSSMLGKRFLAFFIDGLISIIVFGILFNLYFSAFLIDLFKLEFQHVFQQMDFRNNVHLTAIGIYFIIPEVFFLCTTRKVDT